LGVEQTVPAKESMKHLPEDRRFAPPEFVTGKHDPLPVLIGGKDIVQSYFFYHGILKSSQSKDTPNFYISKGVFNYR
jgi:hypothetical protein